ncbi:hypothetical protein [Streptomyces sp. OR43]|uniref:hypothetical protein n=1 Tax=Streptomyces sp. or43 TaxID=2478957 RepID=UPI0011CDC132|nr:hypothetical protein [Streptomyces sp. or43]TXS37768.1 hypothetical protein EAO72_31370 [Streptomyces sp. or43]
MSIRRTTKSRRVAAAASMVAALAFVVTGCGGDGGGKEGDAGSSSSAKPSEEGKGPSDDTAAGDKVDPNVKLAEVKGQNGVLLVVNEVKRDSGGFVTVQGEIKNEGDLSVNPAAWAGNESVIVRKNLNSVGGATLVDKAGKKRYYILRDTDGRCLCTTGIRPLAPGKSLPVFMQFPAPPDTTTEVDLSLPTFATTSLKISG